MLEIKQLNITPKGHREPLLQIDQWHIADGQIATVMGPSGVGKSTLLRWLLGEPLRGFDCQGELWLDGRNITALPIHQRGIGLMYQQGDLFPHFSVAENLLFALPRQPRRSKAEALGELQATLAQLGLVQHLHRAPGQLSGGERARIALLRSLLAAPRALLLDEPFAALDSELRAHIRQFTYQQIMQRQIPAIVVTHNPEDRALGPCLVLSHKGVTTDV